MAGGDAADRAVQQQQQLLAAVFTALTTMATTNSNDAVATAALESNIPHLVAEACQQTVRMHSELKCVWW